MTVAPNKKGGPKPPSYELMPMLPTLRRYFAGTNARLRGQSGCALSLGAARF